MTEEKRLGKWRNPQGMQMRVYVNGLESLDAKVWFERGDRLGTVLPPIYAAKLCTNSYNRPADHPLLRQEVAEVLEEFDLILENLQWEKLLRNADW